MGESVKIKKNGVIMKYFFALIGLTSMPTFAATADLSTSDLTGISFWLVTAAMLAATVFFFAERDVVHKIFYQIQFHFNLVLIPLKSILPFYQKGFNLKQEVHVNEIIQSFTVL